MHHKKAFTVCAVLISAATLLLLLSILAIFQMHLAIVNSEPDPSGWVLTNESYEINIEIVTGDMGKRILRYCDGQWQYEN